MCNDSEVNLSLEIEKFHTKQSVRMEKIKMWLSHKDKKKHVNKNYFDDD